MTRREIVNRLKEMGFIAKEVETVKNGVKFLGISILENTESHIAPVIYTESIIRDANALKKSLDEVVTEILNLYERHRRPQFDVEKFLNRDFVLSNIYIAMQKESEEVIVKEKSRFEGIESYLYVNVGSDEDSVGTMKVNPYILDTLHISEEVAWKMATVNTKKDTVVRSLIDMLSGMLCVEDMVENNEAPPMYVFSNRSGVKGASAIYNKEELEKLAEKHGVGKLVVLPSSIHEMLVLPYDESMDMDSMSDMVKVINANEVPLEECLTDRAYLIDVF